MSESSPTSEGDTLDVSSLRTPDQIAAAFAVLAKAWLPDGYSQIFRLYVFGPSGFWTMAPLRYTAKFDTFLSPRPPTRRNPREVIKFCSVA